MHNNTKKKLKGINHFIQDNYHKWQEAYPDLIGAYPGQKTRNKQSTGRYSIVFMMTEKKKNPETPIPTHYSVSVPGLGKKKVPTDVIETERFVLKGSNLCDRAQRKSFQEVGAVGAFLVKDGNIYACTNTHVVRPEVFRDLNTDFYCPIDKQYQPDVLLYNNDGKQALAYLERAVFDGIDAAICRLDDPGTIGNEIPGIGLPTGIKEIKYGDRGYALRTVGAVSGLQRGVVENIGLTVSSPIPGIDLRNLIVTSMYTDNGDSGSPVFNEACQIVGIVVGGTSSKTYVIPIRDIIIQLGCDDLLF
jgi:hypothetical protein